MARQKKPTKSSSFQRSSRKANALGYAKRQSLKSSKSQSISDVYEYTPEKTRRSKIKLDLTREEAPDGDWDAEEVRARLIGENEDDEMIASEDDEEIDSDVAFEESDEERFAGFSFNAKGKKKTPAKKAATSRVRFADVDLAEDAEDAVTNASEKSGGESDEDDEEEEGDPDDFIDVLDFFDGKGELDGGNDQEVKGHSERIKTALGEDNEDEDDMDDEDIPFPASDVESEGDGNAALEELESFISKLDTGKKRKQEDGDAKPADQPPRKRRIIKEQTEGGLESEFNAHSSTSKLTLTDFLNPLSGHASSLLSLKKSTKALSLASAAALSAPLPQRTQDRLDREAAYEQTKTEVHKWNDTMKRIEKAEHLSFPLQAPPESKTSNLELTAKFKPTTALESSIDKLLKSAKLREQDIEKTENLKMNHLSVEEVAARRGELRKMRELMFRAEMKAKRVAKIKSKTYRRIRKKEKERLAAKLGDDDDDEETVRMKREVERAKERATLRHKNTGKWAKAMRARGELDVDERREIGEMLERGERLRKKIRGEEESDESDSSGDEDEDDEERLEKIKKGAFDEIQRLNEDEENNTPEEGKGVFQMKFMKHALDREKQKADRLADDFIEEMGGRLGEAGEAEDSGEDQGETSNGPVVQRMGGRVSYHPGETIPPRPQALQSEDSSVTLKSTDPPPESPPISETADTTPPASITPQESNPWLGPRATSLKAPRKKNEIVVGKDSADLDKSKHKLKKQAKKHQDEKAKEKEDATVEISVDEALVLKSNPHARPSTVEKKKKEEASGALSRGSEDDEDEDSDHDSEVEEQEKALSGKGTSHGIKAFEQRDLVALAFAGDNVVESFEEEKRAEIDKDAPKEVDTTLEGWGSWGGKGTQKRAPKPYFIKKVPGVDPKSRADHDKKHVIISEKRDKKAAKYLVKDLPYPYTSKAQFERGMETPIGAEWNTRVGFQRGTLPRVVKKMGTVIEPLQKLF